MMSFLTCLLAAALSVQTAHSLVCFQCEAQTSNWNCLKPVTCPNSDDQCMTAVQFGGIGSTTAYISKGCSPICIATNLNLGVIGSATNCCNSFLCNISSATSVKVSYMAMAVSAAFLCILLRARL
ncbi:lymphocyte antigen 6E-like [Microcaecilia unicolor]|uniref:Lymphocyte antigen 6E-like n=1 Tax=Microcaecilia unicolor TaxID=1415580 RepID=A0A6P7ZGW3_9AMPH|nr:lymphocyte antigen 6E-like [Microcaecilia unicolor]